MMNTYRTPKERVLVSSCNFMKEGSQVWGSGRLITQLVRVGSILGNSSHGGEQYRLKFLTTKSFKD